MAAFWYLLLAHFLADYPLQTNWMVRNKTRLWVLLLHVSIHFVVLLLVTLPAAINLWPYLLTLSVVHFFIDAGKNWFTIHRPAWIRWPYMIDQLIHFLSIGLVAAWMQDAGIGLLAIPPRWVVYATGFLLVTYVWLVTERVLGPHPERGSQSEPGAQEFRCAPTPNFRRRAQTPTPALPQLRPWSRMFFRAAFLALLLLAWNLFAVQSRSMAAGLLPVLLPYPATRAGLRILLVDMLVTSVVAAMVIVVNG